MQKQGLSEKQILEGLVDNETRHLDFVASWETLNNVYDTLRFKDDINDSTRLEEYRWIIGQLNSFLAKVRTKLMKAKDFDAAIHSLEEVFPVSDATINNRKTLAYYKLKQQWISRLATAIQQIAQTTEDGAYDE